MFISRKPDPFFVSLLKIAENMKEAIHYVNDAKYVTISDLQGAAIRLKQYETFGDKLVHELIVMLNKSFMTPIEREDILDLAKRLDDVLNGMEHAIAHFEMFSFTELDESMKAFLHNITKCADEIVIAIELLNRKSLIEMRKHILLIKDYERECDKIARSSIKRLFQTEKDPIRLMKFKDIYNQLEDIADYCQDVANTLDTIIMRNA